jgi:aldehyde dehydrogenase (NAD+)
VSGKTFETVNPSNNKTICSVAEGQAEDVDLAVKAADAAFALGSPWRTMNVTERSALLFKFADLMERDADHLASLESLDNGKPWAIARAGDVALSIKCYRFLTI